MEDGIDNLGDVEGLQTEFCGILRDNTGSNRSAVAAIVRYIRTSSHSPSSIQQVLLRMSTLDPTPRSRLCCLLALDKLVCRWTAFRKCMMSQLHPFLHAMFGSNATGTDAERSVAVEMLSKWQARFVESFPRLAIARNHVVNVAGVAVPRHPEVSEVTRLKKELCRINEIYEEQCDEVAEIVQSLTSCFEILLPSTGFHDEETAIVTKQDDVAHDASNSLRPIPSSLSDLDSLSGSEDQWFSSDEEEDNSSYLDGNVEEEFDAADNIQTFGLASRQYEIKITFRTDFSVLQTAGNECVFESIRDSALQLSKTSLPLIREWMQAIQSSRKLARLSRSYKRQLSVLGEHACRRILRLQQTVQAALDRCEQLGVRLRRHKNGGSSTEERSSSKAAAQPRSIPTVPEVKRKRMAPATSTRNRLLKKMKKTNSSKTSGRTKPRLKSL